MTRSNRFRRKLTRHKKKILGGASRKSKLRDRRHSHNTRRQQLIIADNRNTQTDAPPSGAVVDSMLQRLRDLAHTRPDITTHPSVRLVAPDPVPILALSRHSSRSPTHLSKRQRKH